MSHVWRSRPPARPSPGITGRDGTIASTCTGRWVHRGFGDRKRGRRDGRRAAECDRRADLADSVGGRVSDHRPRTGGGGIGTVAADRPPVTERQTLSAPPRLRRTADGATRPARRLAMTAASFAIFSTAAFGVVAATAPEVVGYSPTAGSPTSNQGPAAPPPDSTGVGIQPPREPAVAGSGGIMPARPAATPRSGRVAGSGSTESGPGSSRSDPGARGAVADVNGTASAPPPVETTDGATPGGQPNPATPPPSRGPIGAYDGTSPTGSSARPTPSDQPSGTQRPGPDQPGSGTGSAQPTRPGSPTSEADGG